MEDNCKNCGTLITGNFCNNCGQKKYKRIDKKYLIDEFQYTILHTNKGFFYTVKNLFKNPGKTTREFIDGNRVNHYKPILLAFVLTGISTFLAFKVIGMNHMQAKAFAMNNNNDPNTQKIAEHIFKEVISFYSNYYTILMMLAIPFFAFASKICFKKWNHNYYEHIVMNAFFYSTYTIYSIIFIYPILYFTRENFTVASLISLLSFFGLSVLLTWFFKEIYNTKPLGDVIIRVLGIGAIMIFLFIFIIIIGSFGFAFYLAKTGEIEKIISR
ncbi:DUF3667 domain-containing protein [Flavobacterium solisilvae]|uniref:DUF3667 domain-containing protein n=1 Tax=Flavobacterium solisilvae TaxID=1852019 RepID=A0ABX1QT56_9FLAO|nr:DUF3667 domain-containing protein [Flavobacterium solisilvae]NMH24132.1 DUF3667 domain-containing protein [Flavobacterium solisilvae]